MSDDASNEFFVRRSGDRIRITAQLIKADDGYHLWSDTYDRSVGDIFVLQDEIAQKILAEAYIAQSEATMGTGPVSTLSSVITQATHNGRTAMAEEAMRLLRQIAPDSASDLQLHLYEDTDKLAELAIHIEQHDTQYHGSEPHNFSLAWAYAQLDMLDEAMALHPRVRLFIAAENGDKDVALALMA